jgi:hypothetical protein
MVQEDLTGQPTKTPEATVKLIQVILRKGFIFRILTKTIPLKPKFSSPFSSNSMIIALSKPSPWRLRARKVSEGNPSIQSSGTYGPSHHLKKQNILPFPKPIFSPKRLQI